MSKNKGLKDFALAMRLQESSGNYRAVNRFGYLGAYQFGKARLLDLGYSIDKFGEKTHPDKYKKAIKLTKDEFLNNSALQDEIFYKHVKDLVKYVNQHYKQYIGKTIRNVTLTLSGLVAGIHLVGAGGLAKWLAGYKVADGNNTPIETYITKFANYNLDT